MSPSSDFSSSERELVLSRVFDAPREKVYRAWTEPALLKQWFAPSPATISWVELDVRPGGRNLIVMHTPQGSEFPSRGVYLDVVPNERIVLTDAYVSAWEPSERPFITLILTFENEKGKTRYTVRACHWTIADREAHEKMGFHAGWSKCTDQLADLLTKI